MITNELSTAFKEITGKDFNRFYHDYRPKLVFYLTKYTKSQELSEDFADDAFIQALLKIKNFNSEKAQIHTWIYKIGENLVIKDYKDRQRLNTVSIDKTNDDNLNISNLLTCDYDKAIEEEIVLQKKTNIIYDAINKLPEKYKQVMTMREIKKMSYVAISEACVENYEYNSKGTIHMPHPKEFLNIEVTNDTNQTCNITFTNLLDDEQIMFDIKPNEIFYIDNEELSTELSDIKIVSKNEVLIKYNHITNLATIKSQIKAGRELIRNMINKQFNQLDKHGIY